MTEDLQLRGGLSTRTQEAYVQAAAQLARHYNCSPERISEEQLRQYFLYLKSVKQHSRSVSTIALCAIRFCFEHTVKRTCSTPSFVRTEHRHIALKRRSV